MIDRGHWVCLDTESSDNQHGSIVRHCETLTGGPSAVSCTCCQSIHCLATTPATSSLKHFYILQLWDVTIVGNCDLMHHIKISSCCNPTNIILSLNHGNNFLRPAFRSGQEQEKRGEYESILASEHCLRTILLFSTSTSKESRMSSLTNILFRFQASMIFKVQP